MLEAFKYTEEMNEQISAIKGSKDRFESSDWSDERFSSIKKALKDYYIAQQDVKCCYCNQHLHSTNNAVWSIDHIIPRSTHPQHTFDSRNLAACCHDCNKSKSDTNVLTSPRKTFPVDSSSYRIVHPHLDTFEDHIHISARYIYYPEKNSRKGKYTIYTCDLLRYAEKFGAITEGVSDNRFEDFVEDALSGQSDPLQIASVLENVASVVRGLSSV